MNNNIPIYRAMKIDSEEFVEGYFWQDIHSNCIDTPIEDEIHDIDPSTLSIHFPENMLDSEDNKIFASISETGGSIITDGEFEYHLIFDGRDFLLEDNIVKSGKLESYEKWKDFKIVGIKNENI